MSRASAPAIVPDAAGAVLLRDALERAGFPGNLLEGPAPELFEAGLAVPRSEAEAALGPLGPLEDAGFIEADGDEVRSRIRIDVCDELLLACDWPAGPGGPADVVGGLNNAVHVLRNLTIRTAVDTALDLGAGSGIQGLTAAAHSGAVVCTDVNERALGYCELNAALNGLEKLTALRGSLFEPVAGRRFGLAVCNPPYVISPDSDFTYRDGGLPGDEFSRRVVEQLPEHLDEGGTAQVVLNWVAGGGDWSERPASWLADSGCDVLVLGLGSDPVLPYAAAWNGPLWSSDHAEFALTVRRWMDHYRASGIEAIGFGALVLRRRPAGAGTRVRALQVGKPPEHSAGDHLVRLLDTFELPDEEALVGRRVRLVPGVVVDQSLAAGETGFTRRNAVVRDPQGLPLEVRLGHNELRDVLELGERPLGDPAAARAAHELLSKGLATLA